MPRPSFLFVLALAAGAVYAHTQMGQTSDLDNGAGADAQAVFADPLASAPQIGVGAGGPSLSDALTIERRASLWFEYARDVSSINSRLTSKGFTTILVPVDRAIMAMGRKPHQGAGDAAENTAAFLAAHVVPGELTEGAPQDTLAGQSVTLKDGKIEPQGVAVIGRKSASNGRIYYLDGVLSD